MEASELMIGDWVKFTSKYGYGTGQVVGIDPMEGTADPTTFTIWKKDKEGNTKFFVGVSKNGVEPIPLTPEILEKNGFEKKTFYGIYDDYFDFDIREYSDGLYIATYHSCEFNIPDQTIHVSWVHELQNFMKHCAIDKTIEL